MYNGRTMKEHELGKSGLRVSALGLGLAALGRPGYINLGHAGDVARGHDVAEMARCAQAVLDAAWAGGVRYFDAARSYGRAEEFLGNWLRLRGITPGSVAVGSKWGYRYTAGWKVAAEKHEVKDHSPGHLQRQWLETQLLLGPWLGLYQVHSATLESGVLDDAAVLKHLVLLKEQGVAVGLSLSGARQAATLEKALATRVDGVAVFDAVQATWNLLERSAGEALAAAHAAAMGVIVKEALANGRLTRRNESPHFAAQRQLLARQAERLGTTLDALALAAVLAQPWAGVVLSGAATVEQLNSNLGATRVQWDAEADDALAALVEPAEDYWATRAALEWN